MVDSHCQESPTLGVSVTWTLAITLTVLQLLDIRRHLLTTPALVAKLHARELKTCREDKVTWSLFRQVLQEMTN